MTKKEVKEVLKSYGFRVLRIFKCENGNMFITAFDGIQCYEIYVCFNLRYATIQTLCAQMIHEPSEISWFDKYFD